MTCWRLYTSIKTSGYNGHDQSCLRNSRRFGVEGLCTYPTQNLPVCERVSLPKTYPFMNGFCLVPQYKWMHTHTNTRTEDKTLGLEDDSLQKVCKVCIITLTKLCLSIIGPMSILSFKQNNVTCTNNSVLSVHACSGIRSAHHRYVNPWVNSTQQNFELRVD